MVTAAKTHRALETSLDPLPSAPRASRHWILTTAVMTPFYRQGHCAPERLGDMSKTEPGFDPVWPQSSSSVHHIIHEGNTPQLIKMAQPQRPCENHCLAAETTLGRWRQGEPAHLPWDWQEHGFHGLVSEMGLDRGRQAKLEKKRKQGQPWIKALSLDRL